MDKKNLIFIAIAALLIVFMIALGNSLSLEGADDRIKKQLDASYEAYK